MAMQNLVADRSELLAGRGNRIKAQSSERLPPLKQRAARADISRAEISRAENSRVERKENSRAENSRKNLDFSKTLDQTLAFVQQPNHDSQASIFQN